MLHEHARSAADYSHVIVTGTVYWGSPVTSPAKFTETFRAVLLAMQRATAGGHPWHVAPRNRRLSLYSMTTFAEIGPDGRAVIPERAQLVHAAARLPARRAEAFVAPFDRTAPVDARHVFGLNAGAGGGVGGGGAVTGGAMTTGVGGGSGVGTGAGGGDALPASGSGAVSAGPGPW